MTTLAQMATTADIVAAAGGVTPAPSRRLETLGREALAKQVDGTRIRLEQFLRTHPADAGETLSAYMFRLFRSPRRDPGSAEAAGVLGIHLQVLGHVAWFEAEAKAKAKREQKERADRQERELAIRRREASPDPEAVAQLVATVNAATKAEARLAVDLGAHRAAEQARETLRRMFDTAQQARYHLATYGESFGEPLVKPDVPAAPEGLADAIKLHVKQGR